MNDDIHDRLRAVCAAAGPEAMLEVLAGSLRERRRWHALVDVRLLEARLELGVSPTGDVAALDAAARERFDARSLAACREAGWPLLDEGQVAAAWMYLRVAAEPAAVAKRLADLAESTIAGGTDDDEAQRRLHEIVGVALWEGAAPEVGIDVILRTQGTCPAVTAFDQAVARLPAARQRAAAARLVSHLHAELVTNLTADLAQRGTAPATSPPVDRPLVALLDAADGLVDGSIHCDVSHLHAVLRIARVCADVPTVTRAWELARYACRLPPDVSYPGTPPFADLGQASRLFYGAQVGHDVDEAVAYFRGAAEQALRDGSGALPAETLALLVWRLGRPAAALHAALLRPAGEDVHGETLPPGTLPGLVEIASAADDFAPLRAACRARGDDVTFAATLVAEAQRCRSQPPGGPQSTQGPGR